MVRGNWQKRVESAEARRKEAKQRKQKVADHRTVKQYAAELIQYSSANNDTPLAIFCEGLPPEDTATFSSKRRGRSNSNASSDPGSHNNKKSHPRSRKNSITKEDDQDEAPMMCRSYFYTGKCPKPCPWPHTACLQSVVTNLDPSAMDDNDASTITMPALCCFRVVDCLTATLAEHELKPTDIVYAVHEKTLIYNRNAGGMLVQHPSRENQERYSPLAASFPGILLRHIVTFLPDEGVASMNGVCSDWHVAMNDPLVWQFLLRRNEWPGQTYSDFYAHATVIRDVQPMLGATGRSDAVVLVTEYKPNQVLVVLRDAQATLYDGRSKVLLQTSLDPYKHTKKRNIEVLAAALDDSVALLCSVTTPNSWKTAYVLVLKQRDAFLLDDDEDAESTVVIDIGEAILNYLLSLEVADHRTLRLMDFLQTHDFGDVEVLPSKTVAACGHGRFLVHVAIVINDDANHTSVVIDRRLVLFSSDAIIWIADSDDDSVCDLQCRDNFVATCSDSGLSYGEILVGVSRLNVDAAVGLVMTRTHIVGYRSLPPVQPSKSSLVFFLADGLKEEEAVTLELGGNTLIEGVSCIRESHLVVFCSEFQEIEQDIPDEEAFGGAWFVMDRDDDDTIRINRALVIHIPTQTVITSIELPKELSEGAYPVSMDYGCQTIAFAANDQIWLSGDDVRDARSQDDAANHHSARKKKKRQPNRGGKKDGFARGMSLRG